MLLGFVIGLLITSTNMIYSQYSFPYKENFKEERQLLFHEYLQFKDPENSKIIFFQLGSRNTYSAIFRYIKFSGSISQIVGFYKEEAQKKGWQFYKSDFIKNSQQNESNIQLFFKKNMLILAISITETMDNNYKCTLFFSLKEGQ